MIPGEDDAHADGAGCKIELKFLELFSAELSRNVDSESWEEYQNVIGSVVKRGSVIGTTRLYFADFHVLRQHNGEDGSGFEASYIFEIGSADGSPPSDDIAIEFARTTVWNRFIPLFDALVSQTDLSFPRLPSQAPFTTIQDLQKGQPEAEATPLMLPNLADSP